jgi:hypothetical protein
MPRKEIQEIFATLLRARRALRATNKTFEKVVNVQYYKPEQIVVIKQINKKKLESRKGAMLAKKIQKNSSRPYCELGELCVQQINFRKSCECSVPQTRADRSN